MGKKKYVGRIESLFEKSPVVDFKSIQRIVPKEYAKVMVHHLLKQGKIIKLSKGIYTKHMDVSLAVFAFKPAYIGLQSALSVYNLWDQETIPVILTTTQVRTGLRSVAGANVLIRKMQQKYFFGYDYIQDGMFYLPYSDKEKTLIDFVVFKQKIQDKALLRLKKEIDVEKLKKYLKHYPQNIQEQVEKVLLSV